VQQAMAQTLEDVFISVWRQTLVEGAASVKIDDETKDCSTRAQTS